MRVRGFGLLLFGGLTMAAACGRTGLGDTPGVSSGQGGAGTAIGGAGGTATGPCGQATCLATLFASCVPKGTCAESGGGSPSATFTSRCYDNGVDVAFIRTAESSTVTVRRDGTLCYSITATWARNASAPTFLVRGGDASPVAEGETADKNGTITMTCKDGPPTPVDHACLAPIDASTACVRGTCS